MSAGPFPERIEIVAAGALHLDEEVLDWLAGELGERFCAPVSRGSSMALRDDWCGAGGDQFNSNHIVDAMIERDEPVGADPPGCWRLALTEADLFAPGRSFVFGEAAQGGAWAVVSLARLRAAPDSPDPAALLSRRILKEAVHELGHLAGLEHCDRQECVMCPSGEVVDTDRKSASFCPACEVRLRDLSGVDRSSHSG